MYIFLLAKKMSAKIVPTLQNTYGGAKLQVT